MQGYGVGLDAKARAADEIVWWTYSGPFHNVPHGAVVPWDVIYVRAKGWCETRRAHAPSTQAPLCWHPLFQTRAARVGLGCFFGIVCSPDG